MPTREQIQHFNDAVHALEEAESAYKSALENYRNDANHDSLSVDRALVARDLAELSLQLAEMQLGK